MHDSRIKKLEEKINIFGTNSITGEVTVSIQPNQTIKGVISIQDSYGVLDKSRSKYLLNTNSSQKLGSSSYEKDGTQIEKLNQEIIFTKEFGTYYLYVILTDIFEYFFLDET